VFRNMEKWVEIRRKVLANEASKRAICREYKLHWDTLQRILTYPEPPVYEQKQPRKKPKLGDFVPLIHEILQSDQKVHRKQRHTAKRIFERLQGEHQYAGGYTGVKDAVRDWRKQHKEVFLPLSHPPGEAQVDFGEADVMLRGETTRVAMFVMTLPYSDAIFCQVFPRECTEAFLEGHRRAFEFFGGVPRRISYDNSKIAVAKITGSRERKVTHEFLRLESHYLFEHHFCLVRRPNEKGHVERLLDFARANFLVPVPATDDLARLNEQLEQSCCNDLERKLRGKPGSKAQLLEEEQAVMLSFPQQSFEARRIVPGQASSLSLVRFDDNDYSVPTAFAHREITIVASVDEVRLVCADRLVARHLRDWGKEHVVYNPLHYLALLERKPGGLDFAKPLENWDLPECFGVLRRRLETEREGEGTREFIKVLRLLEHADPCELGKAIDYALDIGTTEADAVRLILEHRREQPVKLFRLDGRPHLADVVVEPPHLDVYRTLLVEV
jgi:transposase